MRKTLAVLLLCLAPRAVLADTLFVEPSGVTPFVEVQDAIDAAVDGDAILVFPGTYGPVDFGGKDITVRSTGGPSLTIIDATGSGMPAALFDDEEPSTALLHGFTLTGGEGLPDDSIVIDAGGGVYITRQSSPRISGNVITGNTADSGAGIAVTGGAPHIYGNEIRGNTATSGAGGVLIFSPAGAPLVTTFVCNDVRANVGGTVGGLLLDGEGLVRNNTVHGNTGDRGGILVALASVGELTNNTITANTSTPGNGGGVEVASSNVPAVGNLVAHNLGGVGVLHSVVSPAWSFGNTWNNAGGPWSGASPNPVGTNGNLELEPFFINFTAGDPLDDDLSLVALDPLRDLGSADAAFLDLDGSTGAIGFDGGPKLDCDGDGDGVRVDDVPSDCLPEEGDFFPGAYELEGGLDEDCDGYGTLSLFEFVGGDGGLLPAGGWVFGEPVTLPGIGWQGTSAWCTDCASGAGGSMDATLEVTADLSTLPASTDARLLMVHAYDTGAAAGGLVQEDSGVGWATLSPVGGYPAAPLASFPGGAGSGGVFGGDSLGYGTDSVDLTAASGTSTDLRFWYLSGAASTADGWTIARLTVQVIDADGDGRAATLTDCDDTDPTIYVGAPEVPYDTIDQDCDGADLVDADGDGFDGVAVGGPDCDDTDADTSPAGVEVPYDGVDQDCSGADLDDVDEDGAASWEVGGPDCDDGDPSIGPSVPDVPYNGVDEDCDGDDLVDVDGDGFRGDQPPPFGDCDDANASVNPDALEICDDGLDNDCNELVDQEIDFDQDGYDRCAGDCDEDSSLVNPGMDETCTGVDDNCDSILLDGEVDGDGDGEFLCAGDCNDANASVGLTRPEVCDGIDNDCDLGVDEGLDLDGDGFSGCTTDCDDQRFTVYPGGPIDCSDNLDHDCDGIRDFEQEECLNPETGCSLGRGQAPSRLWLLVCLSVAWARRRSGRSGRAV
ncbi:MAG: right-handed parallel beta-helix repeat-containing protein [Deltaproteobacteria bacterium]|nr:right-handed parallel beta-helix repeat-containing protein [Deltaproteobacteria bacterium]